MGVSLEIDDIGFRELFRIFSDENKNRILTAIGDLELSKTRSRFVKQVDPDGNPWAPTVRKAIDPSAKILRKSGVMFNSIQRQVSGNSVFIGTNIRYAQTHQDGAVIRPKVKNFLKFKIGNQFVTKKEVTIPQRRFIGINSETEKSIDVAFNTVLGKILK